MEGGGCSWKDLAELSWGDRDVVGVQDPLPDPGHFRDWQLPTFLHVGLFFTSYCVLLKL